MANTFSDDIDVLGLHRIVVHGTVDDPSNVAKVEIFLEQTSLGTARVSANGHWRLPVALPKLNGTEVIEAKVTDAGGNQSDVFAKFTLQNHNAVALNNFFQVTITGDKAIDSNVFD